MGLTNLGLGINMIVKGNAQEGFAKIGNEFGKFTKMLPGGLGSMLTLGAELGVVGLAAMAAKKAFTVMADSVTEGLEIVDQFEMQMAKLAVRMGPTNEKAFGQTTRMVRNMATQFGLSTDDLSTATGKALSAGVAAKRMPEIMAVAGKMAVGGSMDAAGAMDTLSSVMNVYGTTTRVAQEASDALFMGMRLGRVDMATLTKEVGGMIPMASKLGVSYRDVVGMVAGLTRQGLSSGQAVAGIQATMVAVLKGNPVMTKMFSQYGVDASRATIKTMGWVKWIQYMNDKIRAGGGNIGRLSRSSEGLNAILAMTGKNAQAMNDVMAQMGASAGAAEFAYGKMAGTDIVFEKRVEEARKSMLMELGFIFDPLENAWNRIRMAFFTTFSKIIVWWKTGFLDRMVSIFKPFFTIIGAYLKGMWWLWSKFFQAVGWIAVKVFNLMTWPMKKISEGFQIGIDGAKLLWEWLGKTAALLSTKWRSAFIVLRFWLAVIGEEIRYRWDQATTFAAMAPSLVSNPALASKAQADVEHFHKTQVTLNAARMAKEFENLSGAVEKGMRKKGKDHVIIDNDESDPVPTKAPKETGDYLKDIFFQNFSYGELSR